MYQQWRQEQKILRLCVFVNCFSCSVFSCKLAWIKRTNHGKWYWKYVYPVMLLLGKEQSFIICRNTMRGFYLNTFGDKLIHPQLKQCCLRDSCSNVSNYWENHGIYMATKALIFVPKKKYHVTVFLVKGYCIGEISRSHWCNC